MADNLVTAGTVICYYPPEVELHGGKCCGRFHIHNFPFLGAKYRTDAALADKIAAVEDAKERGATKLYVEYGERYDEENDEYFDFDMAEASYVAEIVLTQSQLPDWHEALLAAGFESVYEFKNSNSGNICHVFLCKVGGGHA